jgi:hypothetical protein
MRRTMIGLGTLGLWAAMVLPAPAAWNNVFQPTLFHRNRQPVAVSQFYVPPTVVASAPVVAASSPCDTCQQTACSTSYTQRCFYQPVTTMTTQTYYEPVTTFRTSFFWEPVTSYRISSFFDPCTCSSQQVATPCTSYQLRAQSCPVQSWVQRCCQVPVTTYQKACYWQPQTTCCTTTQGAPIVATPAPPVLQQQIAPQQVVPQQIAPQQVVPQQAVPQQPTAPVPQITQPQYPPNVYEQRTPGTGTSTPNPGIMPPASLRTPAPPAPPLKLEGIVMMPDSRLEGQVVRNDRSPQANAKVALVNAQAGQRYFATANTAGRFSIRVPSGNWLVYLYGADDLPVLSTQLQVTGSQLPVAMR